ncbi:flagellar hook-length control protein FliK [Candidatus Margulisiibacteriota bacterium]
MATGPIQTGQGAQPYQPNRPVQKPDGTIQSGQVREDVSVQRAPTEEAVDAAKQTAQQQAATTPFKTIARKMSMRDIVSQLFQYGIEASEENRNLAVKMLLMGVELSKENFNRLFNVLKGFSGDSFMQEAAIIALRKGLDDSPAALKMLANFLRENPQLAQQLRGTLTTMASLQTAIASGQNLLSSSVIAQLSAILAQLDGNISQLPSALQKRKKGELFSREELLSSLRLSKSLIDGVKDQLAKAPTEENSYIINQLLAASKETQALIENLVTQAVLSKPPDVKDTAMSEQFAYWQIPNSLAENPKTIELLIKRDMTKQGNPINPRKTKIILKTETKELGELGIEMDVEENNLNIKFNTPEDQIVSFIKAHMEDLQKRMAAQNYKTKNIQVVRKHLDVKQFLIPMLELDDLRRVHTEA